jgi:hypothetical protein
LKPKTRAPLFLLSLAGLLAAGAALLFAWSVPVLQLENLETGRIRFFRIRPPERFSLAYRHSMYDAPVTEEFEAGNGGITLKGVRTRHPGVMEYYGFDRVADYHPREVLLAGPILVKKGIREGQGLVIHDRPLALGDLAENGQRIAISLRRVPLGEYLLRMER